MADCRSKRVRFVFARPAMLLAALSLTGCVTERRDADVTIWEFSRLLLMISITVGVAALALATWLLRKNGRNAKRIGVAAVALVAAAIVFVAWVPSMISGRVGLTQTEIREQHGWFRYHREASVPIDQVVAIGDVTYVTPTGRSYSRKPVIVFHLRDGSTRELPANVLVEPARRAVQSRGRIQLLPPRTVETE